MKCTYLFILYKIRYQQPRWASDKVNYLSLQLLTQLYLLITHTAIEDEIFIRDNGPDGSCRHLFRLEGNSNLAVIDILFYCKSSEN